MSAEVHLPIPLYIYILFINHVQSILVCLYKPCIISPSVFLPPGSFLFCIPCTISCIVFINMLNQILTTRSNGQLLNSAQGAVGVQCLTQDILTPSQEELGIKLGQAATPSPEPLPRCSIKECHVT